MRSETAWEVGKAASDIVGGAMSRPTEVEEAGVANHMSQRQLELDRLWRVYRCSQYENRKYDWNGHERVGHIEHEAIAHTGFIPPGFTDAGGALVPLQFRDPCTPVHLERSVVNRFTSLLFSEKRHPTASSDDDDTTEWLRGFAEVTRLWAQWARARTYGGAMGSVAVGFKFVRGRPIVEVHDPRWVTVTYADRDLGTLARFEKLYQFPEEVKNAEGEWEQKWYWYRRVINTDSDTVWAKVPVEPGEFPNWEREQCEMVRHGFGFCPVQWVQNLDLDDSIDGDPDCHGIFDLCERINVLWSQADRGVVANCDPSVVISSDAEFDAITKGSGNALQRGKGESATYMEMTGGGTARAVELAEKLEQRALLIARCVLDKVEDGPAVTATEVEHKYSNMIEQADMLREQYGEKGIKPFLEMVLRAAHMLDTATKQVGEGGVPKIVRTVIIIPKRKVLDDKGKVTGWVERKLGTGSIVELTWPAYFQPSSGSISSKVDAAGKARQMGLLDRKHAVDFIADDFNIENKVEMIEQLEADDKLARGPDPAELAAQRSEQPVEELDIIRETQKEKIELTGTDLGIIVTVDEAREAHGLPPLGTPDGMLTVAAFKAKYRKMLIKAAEATDPTADDMEQQAELDAASAAVEPQPQDDVAPEAPDEEPLLTEEELA